MIQAEIDWLAQRATHSVRTIHGHPIDEETAYKVMDSFLSAYRKRNHERYHGNINLGNLCSVLNAYTLYQGAEDFFSEEYAMTYFTKIIDNDKARAVTFSQYATHITSRIYGLMYGLK